MATPKRAWQDTESEAERAFFTRWLQLHTLEGAEYEPQREHKFAAAWARDWRFDFAWPVQKVAVEIEGGTWKGKGGHTTGVGYQKDCEKYNAAIELGWRVLRYTPQMVEAEPADVIQQIECVLHNTYRIKIISKVTP